MNEGNENTDVTIKVVTEGMAIEVKLLIYSFLCTVGTINMWLYTKILKNIKDLYKTKKRHSNSYEELSSNN